MSTALTEPDRRAEDVASDFLLKRLGILDDDNYLSKLLNEDYYLEESKIAEVVFVVRKRLKDLMSTL